MMLRRHSQSGQAV